MDWQGTTGWRGMHKDCSRDRGLSWIYNLNNKRLVPDAANKNENIMAFVFHHKVGLGCSYIEAKVRLSWQVKYHNKRCWLLQQMLSQQEDLLKAEWVFLPSNVNHLFDLWTSQLKMANGCDVGGPHIMNNGMVFNKKALQLSLAKNTKGWKKSKSRIDKKQLFKVH